MTITKCRACGMTFKMDGYTLCPICRDINNVTASPAVSAAAPVRNDLTNYAEHFQGIVEAQGELYGALIQRIQAMEKAGDKICVYLTNNDANEQESILINAWNKAK